MENGLEGRRSGRGDLRWEAEALAHARDDNELGWDGDSDSGDGEKLMGWRDI